MARFLTREEILQYKNWLCEWRLPEDMLQYYREVTNEIGSATLFAQAGIEFLREAWGAATFGKLRSASKVRLPMPRHPDFELQISDKVEQFEFTEALEAERKRGIEYQETARRMKAEKSNTVVYHDSEEDLIKRVEDIPIRLRERAEQKSKKTYPPGTNLLIYLNTRDFVTERSEIERIQALFQPRTSLAKDKFAEIWILWKDSIYKVWSHGRPANQPTPTAE